MHQLASMPAELLDGVVWGLIFALVALGLNLIFGLVRVINMAHGSLYMVGAMVGWYLARLSHSFWLALLAAPLVVGLLGICLEWLVLRRTYRRDVVVGVLATAGLLLVIDNASLAIFGGVPESIASPIAGSISVAGTHYPLYRIAVAGIALLSVVLLRLFLQRTGLGLWMRAVPQAPELALAVGVPISRVNALTVGLGAYFAGLAGVLAAPIVAVYYQMGLDILAPAFIVVVAGGMGSLGGTLVAALILGLSRGVLAAFVAPSAAEMLALLVLVPVLIFKPEGFFGGASSR
ncbi:MAG: branched-chain amino acid ABC transporter permease [Rhizobiaceae bacterium]|nr:MAG: branched-chain amino acid ABC transporter permease [Rhizobiaceae bacterium]